MKPSNFCTQFKLFNPCKKSHLPTDIRNLNITEKNESVHREKHINNTKSKIAILPSQLIKKVDSINDCSVPQKYLDLNRYFNKKIENSFHSYREYKQQSIIQEKSKKKCRLPSFRKISVSKDTKLIPFRLSKDNDNSKSLSFLPKIESSKTYHKQEVLSRIFSSSFCPNKFFTESLDITHLKSRGKNQSALKRKGHQYRFGVTPKNYIKLIEVLNLEGNNEEKKKEDHSHIVQEDEFIDIYKRKGNSILEKYSTSFVKSYEELNQEEDSNKKRKNHLQLVETVQYWIDCMLRLINNSNYHNKEEVNAQKYVYIYAMNLISKNCNEINEKRIWLMIKLIISLYKLFEDKKEKDTNLSNEIKDLQRNIISQLHSELSLFKENGICIEKENEEIRKFLIPQEQDGNILDAEKKELVEKLNKLEFEIEIEEKKNNNNPFSEC